jgi:uncharacterized membrane-anchored protein
MSGQRAMRMMEAAVDAGLLPPGVGMPGQEQRPWPVVLLTALGAWLAAVPLLGVVGLLLGDLIRQGAGPYLVGVLMLAAAVILLRRSAMPLFVEQLAVPALMVGAGVLAFGLFRDLHWRSAVAVLGLLFVGLAAALPRPWLRVLLGAAAAQLVAVGCVVGRPDVFSSDHIDGWWWGWHAALAVWALAMAAQRRLLREGGSARVAAALESISVGWLLATLAGLAWWSGMSFLAGAGDPVFEAVMREVSAGRWQAPLLHIASIALALAAACWLARAWPSLRRPWCVAAAAALLPLAWFLPALGAVLLALAHCVRSHRWRQSGAAALAAAWIIGGFYYQLVWPLADKALVLVAAGAVLGGLAWWAQRDGHGAAMVAHAGAGPAPVVPDAFGRAHIGIGATALVVLLVANIGIWQKERVIAHGQPVYVSLAPVDPRSLMQGDYMSLRFGLPGEVEDRLEGLVSAQRPCVVVRRDARGVASVLRLDDGRPLAADELRIELTPKGGRWTLVSDAWYFKEGEAERWQPARFAEFRVAVDGQALLVGLRDANLKPL